MGHLNTLTQGRKHERNREEDRKLNCLVNVSNQGTDLPGIGCLSRTAH